MVLHSGTLNEICSLRTTLRSRYILIDLKIQHGISDTCIISNNIVRTYIYEELWLLIYKQSSSLRHYDYTLVDCCDICQRHIPQPPDGKFQYVRASTSVDTCFWITYKFVDRRILRRINCKTFCQIGATWGAGCFAAGVSSVSTNLASGLTLISVLLYNAS